MGTFVWMDSTRMYLLLVTVFLFCIKDTMEYEPENIVIHIHEAAPGEETSPEKPSKESSKHRTNANRAKNMKQDEDYGLIFKGNLDNTGVIKGYKDVSVDGNTVNSGYIQDIEKEKKEAK